MSFKFKVIIGALLLTAVVASPQSDEKKGPVFTKDGQLVLPTGYRSWVFIGGPITPNGLNDGHAPFPEFHSVYIEKENFRYYQKNGKFPEGTVMVKELALVQGGGHSDGSIKILASPASMRNAEWPCHVWFIGIVRSNVVQSIFVFRRG